ncbi:MAG: DNA-processing protein DprA [Desulfitobacteriaceae bacterium]
MDIYWLWLSHLPGIGPVTQRKLIQALISPENVYKAAKEELAKVGIRMGVVDTILSSRSLDKAKIIEQRMQQHGVKLLPFTDTLYPQYLNLFHNMPAILYYCGTLTTTSLSIGIVGSRRCTDYGKRVAAEAASFLAGKGVTVVSGMAKGIDSYAHTACIKNGGYTLAFVANGPEICYPPEHRSLMDEIIENGAIISLYPPGTRPRPQYFPARNELLSAWVDKLLVVEASETSGAMGTAHSALRYKRTVLAVPNHIYSTESAGALRLLQVGAEVYIEPKQLLNSDNIDCEVPKLSLEPSLIHSQEIEQTLTTPLQKIILERLDHKPQAISAFKGLINDDIHNIFSILCEMELEGKVAIKGEMVSKVIR